MFMTYFKRGMMMPDEKMLEVMAIAAQEGGIAMVHPENGYGIEYLIDKFTKAGKISREFFMPSQPNILEVEAVQRACAYASITGCPLYCVHLSAREIPGILQKTKMEVRNIFGETCPQYLSLTNQVVMDRGPLAKVGPPLREKEDNEAIWQALGQHIIDTVASDSANIKAIQKQWGGSSKDTVTELKANATENIFDARFGAAFAEQMLPVVYQDGVNCGRITLPRLVQVMCENPAKIFGLYPRKGTLQVGSDADLVLFDPTVKVTLSEKTIHSNADFTLFEGKQIIGATVFSMQRGEVIIQDGELKRKQGKARFVPGNKDLAAYAEHGFPVE
jgi:dihydropyrimidinase